MWVYTGVIDQVYFLNVNLHKFKISHLLIFFHKDAFWLFIKLFKKCKIIHSVTSKHCFGTTWAKNYRSSTPNFFLMILSQINALYDADRSSVIYNEWIWAKMMRKMGGEIAKKKMVVHGLTSAVWVLSRVFFLKIKHFLGFWKK